MAANQGIHQVVSEIEKLMEKIQIDGLNQTLDIIRGYLQGTHQKDDVCEAIDRQNLILNDVETTDDSMEIWNQLDHIKYILEDEDYINLGNRNIAFLVKMDDEFCDDYSEDN